MKVGRFSQEGAGGAVEDQLVYYLPRTVLDVELTMEAVLMRPPTIGPEHLESFSVTQVKVTPVVLPDGRFPLAIDVERPLTMPWADTQFALTLSEDGLLTGLNASADDVTAKVFKAIVDTSVQAVSLVAAAARVAMAETEQMRELERAIGDVVDRLIGATDEAEIKRLQERLKALDSLRERFEPRRRTVQIAQRIRVDLDDDEGDPWNNGAWSGTYDVHEPGAIKTNHFGKIRVHLVPVAARIDHETPTQRFNAAVPENAKVIDGILYRLPVPFLMNVDVAANAAFPDAGSVDEFNWQPVLTANVSLPQFGQVVKAPFKWRFLRSTKTVVTFSTSGGGGLTKLDLGSKSQAQTDAALAGASLAEMRRLVESMQEPDALTKHAAQLDAQTKLLEAQIKNLQKQDELKKLQKPSAD